jgi:hypothetical protein
MAVLLTSDAARYLTYFPRLALIPRRTGRNVDREP